MKTTLMSLRSAVWVSVVVVLTRTYSSFGSIGSLADITGMEDQFRNPLSRFSRDGDNSKSSEKGRVIKSSLFIIIVILR